MIGIGFNPLRSFRLRNLSIDTISVESPDHLDGRFSGASTQIHRPDDLHSPHGEESRRLFWRSQSSGELARMNDLSQSGRSATISPELREGNGDEDPAQAASSEHSAAAIADAVAALIHADHFMQTMVKLTPTFNARYRQTRVRDLLTTAVGAACTTANFLKKIERGECTDISPDEQDNLEHQLIALSNEATALCDQMQQTAARYSPVAGSVDRVHDAAIRMLQQTCDFIDRSTVSSRAAMPPAEVLPEPNAIEACMAWIRHRQC